MKWDFQQKIKISKQLFSFSQDVQTSGSATCDRAVVFALVRVYDQGGGGIPPRSDPPGHTRAEPGLLGRQLAVLQEGDDGRHSRPGADQDQRPQRIVRGAGQRVSCSGCYAA
jgi:hypothetical protein